MSSKRFCPEAQRPTSLPKMAELCYMRRLLVRVFVRFCVHFCVWVSVRAGAIVRACVEGHCMNALCWFWIEWRCFSIRSQEETWTRSNYFWKRKKWTFTPVDMRVRPFCWTRFNTAEIRHSSNTSFPKAPVIIATNEWDEYEVTKLSVSHDMRS